MDYHLSLEKKNKKNQNHPLKRRYIILFKNHKCVITRPISGLPGNNHSMKHAFLKKIYMVASFGFCTSTHGVGRVPPNKFTHIYWIYILSGFYCFNLIHVCP